MGFIDGYWSDFGFHYLVFIHWWNITFIIFNRKVYKRILLNSIEGGNLKIKGETKIKGKSLEFQQGFYEGVLGATNDKKIRAYVELKLQSVNMKIWAKKVAKRSRKII